MEKESVTLVSCCIEMCVCVRDYRRLSLTDCLVASPIGV